MPIANGAAGVVGSPLPKWQLALAVGAPVALGLGYMYYRNTARPDPGSTKRTKANGTSGDKQISIDGESPPNKTKTDSEPQNPTERAQKYKNLGNTVFKAGKYDEAIAYYNQAIEICPEENESDLATFYQNRAAAYEQLKNYNAVKKDCTKALELKPRYAKALLRRARALERMNELEAVLEDVSEACMLEEYKNKSSIQMGNRVLNQLGRQHAQELMKNRKPLLVSKYDIKTHFNSFSRNPFAQENTQMANGDNTVEGLEGLDKAKQAIKEERYDDVIPICMEYIERFGDKDTPIKMQLYILRAMFYIFLGQYNIAIEDLETVIKNETVGKALRVYALINRAIVHMKLENLEKCFESYDTAVEIDPDCGDIYYYRGQLNLLLQKIDEAREDAEKASRLAPDFDQAFAKKCYIDYRYAVMKRSDELVVAAVENFQKAFEKFPDCVECHALYAQVLADSEQFEKADEHFKKAMATDPTNAAILVHRALLRLQWLGDVTTALDYMHEALEIDDKNALTYETLGTIEYQRGNVKEALELFDKALLYGRSAMDLTHTFTLKNAMLAQLKVSERVGVDF